MDTYITKIKPFNNLNGMASILINNQSIIPQRVFLLK